MRSEREEHRDLLGAHSVVIVLQMVHKFRVMVTYASKHLLQEKLAAFVAGLAIQQIVQLTRNVHHMSLEQDLFGTSKPSPDQYLTHLELYRAVEHIVDPSHLKALQRVRGLWRLYFDNHEDRDKTLTNGLVIRKKLIQTYARNPKTAENENPNNVRPIRIRAGFRHFHPESCQNDVSQTTQAADAEHKIISFTFNKQESCNLDDNSNLSEKKQSDMSKAKRAKNKKDKQNTNKDQPSMERFLAEAFRTPSNKTNEEKKTRTKQTASTPTDELQKREEPVKKSLAHLNYNHQLQYTVYIFVYFVS
ncbi:unnamed protein product [Mytilus edulis]|uniref:Uncharacterized protein n=1 Tax=Mytilus edulis TaxID=6550 RepID=A0A8S3V3V4_MYTED|nr:unnamed protein product [Mytilus edulis]